MSWELLQMDCRTAMSMFMEPDSIDSCVTDPPYHLTSIVKRFGAANAAPAKSGKTGAYARASKGFMGQTWDGGDVAFDPETWAAVYRVLKPGAHLVAFSGTRTYHRMVCAIEDAGFEIRDQLAWVYGSGFPKSHNQPGGWGTALKPAWEPIVLARKPLAGTVAATIALHGTGAINIDGCRIDSEGGKAREGEASQDRRYTDKGSTNFAATPGPRGGDPLGRWPANIIHDGSEEVLAHFPESNGQLAKASTSDTQRAGQNVYGDMSRGSNGAEPRGDKGSAARFFYCAKANKKDRNAGCANNHPTVKPTELMRYLCRLVTPPGGRILDPFAGSGSTGRGALLEGFSFTGCEMSADYAEIARARIADALRS